MACARTRSRTLSHTWLARRLCHTHNSFPHTNPSRRFASHTPSHTRPAVCARDLLVQRSVKHEGGDTKSTKGVTYARVNYHALIAGTKAQEESQGKERMQPIGADEKHASAV
eukprot:3342813-Pleurochrysis_carterae.AAC.1